MTSPAAAVVVVTRKWPRAEARDRAVVHHEAVLAQHDARSGPGRPAASRSCWRRPGRGRRPRPAPARRSCRASRRRRRRPRSRTIATSRSQASRQVGLARRAGSSSGGTTGPPRRSGAPRAAIAAWVGVRRCGREARARRRPPRAPRSARRVGRAEGGGAGLGDARGRSARRGPRAPATPPVLPWSVAMPSVV